MEYIRVFYVIGNSDGIPYYIKNIIALRRRILLHRILSNFIGKTAYGALLN